MNDPRPKQIARELCSMIEAHWNEYGEPYSLSLVAPAFDHRIKKCLGFDCTVRWYCELLEKANVLIILRSRAGKRWLLVRSLWDSLTPEKQIETKTWTQSAICPMWAAIKSRRHIGHMPTR